MVRTALVLGTALVALGVRPALADGQIKELAKEGYWVAASHAPSANSPADICIAVIPAVGFYILSGKGGAAELRVSNSSWSLPANITGAIKLAVNGNSYSVPFSSTTANSVEALLTPVQFIMIVGDLEASSSMDLTVGSVPTDTVPLDGGKTVLTAFMSCNGSLTQ